MTDMTTWTGVSFKDWLFKQFDEGKVSSPEVKALAEVMDKTKLRALYEEWKLARGKV